MKKIVYAALGLAIFIASSCKKNESLEPVQKELVTGATVDTLKGDITVNTTVTRDTYLKGYVFVRPGVTLTVMPGVTIKGSPRYSFDRRTQGTLIIERGAKLIANGTASSPIVWTAATAVGTRSEIGNQWGGIVILGRAPISEHYGKKYRVLSEFQHHEYPTDSAKVTFGGTISNDNSGSITYNRIEFASHEAPSSSMGGLSLCGVGTGTTLHHIEAISSASKMGFSFLGGTVNADHLLSFNNGDDDFHFQEGYIGRLQFIIAYKSERVSYIYGQNLISVSSVDGPINPKTKPSIANATLIALTGYHGYSKPTIHLKNGRNIILANSLIIGMKNPILRNSVTTSHWYLDPADPDASALLNNILQSTSSLPVLEVNCCYNRMDWVLLDRLKNTGNTHLTTPEAFMLDERLKPLPTSPARNGGINLAQYGFVGTTERGAILSTDAWTNGGWISIETE